MVLSSPRSAVSPEAISLGSVGASTEVMGSGSSSNAEEELEYPQILVTNPSGLNRRIDSYAMVSGLNQAVNLGDETERACSLNCPDFNHGVIFSTITSDASPTIETLRRLGYEVFDWPTEEEMPRDQLTTSKITCIAEASLRVKSVRVQSPGYTDESGTMLVDHNLPFSRTDQTTDQLTVFHNIPLELAFECFRIGATPLSTSRLPLSCVDRTHRIYFEETDAPVVIQENRESDESYADKIPEVPSRKGGEKGSCRIL